MKTKNALLAALAVSLASPSAAAARERAATRGAAAAPTVLTVPRPAGPEWFGVYLLGRKAGFSRTQVSVETRGGRRVLVAQAEETVSATVGTKTVERSQTDEK